MLKRSRLVVLGGTLAALAFAAVALAGKATIHDGTDSHVSRCLDINTVKANVGKQKANFGVVMVGSAKSKPCNGKAAPQINIDLDGDKIPDCYVAIGEGEGQTGKPGIFCGQSNYQRKGPATVELSKHNPKKWKLNFHTKDIPGKPDSIRFFVYSYWKGETDDTHDSGGWAKVKIG